MKSFLENLILSIAFLGLFGLIGALKWSQFVRVGKQTFKGHYE